MLGGVESANQRTRVEFEVWPEAIELGHMFADEGYELALVEVRYVTCFASQIPRP